MWRKLRGQSDLPFYLGHVPRRMKTRSCSPDRSHDVLPLRFREARGQKSNSPNVKPIMRSLSKELADGPGYAQTFRRPAAATFHMWASSRRSDGVWNQVAIP